MDLMDHTSKSESEERCGGTGLVSYWDGGGYVGEGCPGCIDCEPPDEPDDSGPTDWDTFHSKFDGDVG
jgi:hypothetical protein